MAEDEVIIPKRVRAAYALSRLSEKLRNAVLNDPETLERWDIAAKRTVPLTAELTVQWGSLLSIFQAAADGMPTPLLLDEEGKEHAVKASINARGAGQIEVGEQRFLFSHAVLMSSSPEKRLRELERIFDATPIHGRLQEELRGIVGQSDFAVDEFIAVAEALSSSPEYFRERLSEKASAAELAVEDFLPTDNRHWDNLTAPIAASGTLSEFIVGELALERVARIARNPVLAFRSIALTCSAPALVPFEVFRPLDKETKQRIVEDALLVDDHFALVAAFELCADWITEYPELSSAGDHLLHRLFGDPRRLEVACGVFGGALVLAIAKIAEDDILNVKPAFWRRLAAASHASLVVRACGVADSDEEDLIDWSVQQSGQAYFLSVFCDFKTDPRWRPHWIEPRFLIADVCGRAMSACSRVPEVKRPPSWTKRCEELRSWVREQGYQSLLAYPAVTEAARGPASPPIDELRELGQLYNELIREPTVHHLLRLAPAIESLGPPREITGSLHKILATIRGASSAEPEGQFGSVVGLLSHIAAVLQDAGLANAVAEACIDRLAVDERREAVVEAIYRILECTAAETDADAARLFLSRKLEQVSFTIMKPETLAELAAWIEHLKMISPDLRRALGRALAIAKLGASRPAAG